MKFAVVEGERREAKPGIPAECPGCGDSMIAKCGDYKVWHWAHRRTRICDHWWESETEWHRAWKNQFPESWQEAIHSSKDGEKHIADVKTNRGVVLEFQHSFLSRDERESREVFYQNMVWVVDGRRRVRDSVRFFASLGIAMVISLKPLIVSVPSREGAPLRGWEAGRVPVYFDFGDNEPNDRLRLGEPVLWRLGPRALNGRAYLSAVSKTSFLQGYLTGLPFEEMYMKLIEHSVANYHLMLMRQASGARPKRARF